MRTGDFDNAILVLIRALEKDKSNLEMQKDLVMSYYLKRDYAKALDGVKVLIDRDDADVVTYQIAGNVYKALEEPKECEKVYKRGLKKFPKSGPLLSEYGELPLVHERFFLLSMSGKKASKLTPPIVETIIMLPIITSMQRIKYGPRS